MRYRFIIAGCLATITLGFSTARGQYPPSYGVRRISADVDLEPEYQRQPPDQPRQYSRSASVATSQQYPDPPCSASAKRHIPAEVGIVSWRGLFFRI